MPYTISVCLDTDSTMPISPSSINKLVPPDEKNGRLMPVFGIVFVTTAMFRIACSVVPQAGERLGCQINVDAGILPVAVQIAVRLKRVHTDSDGGRIGGQRVILPRAGAQPRRQRRRQRKAKPPALCPGNARSHSRT